MATITGKTAEGVEVVVQVDANGILQVTPAAETTQVTILNARLDDIEAQLSAIAVHLGV